MKMGMRAVVLPWENATFEPFPDDILHVGNSAQLDPYPRRLTERLQHWGAVAPDRVISKLDLRLRRRAGAARSGSLRLAARPHLVWQWNRARPVIARVSACGHTVCSAVGGLLVDFDGFCQEERI
jgi:hypothetical protein